jgi:Skp family chaperone for outer membrane proteins
MSFMEKVRRASKSVVDAGAKQMLKVRALCNKQASSRNRNRNRNRNFNRVTSEYERDSKRKKKQKTEKYYSSLAIQHYRSIGGLSPVE